MRVKTIMTLCLCAAMAMPAYAEKSPVGEVIKKEVKEKSNRNTNNSAEEDLVPVSYTAQESLVSPETGILDAVHVGFVDDIGTEVPEGAFDEEKQEVNWEKIEEINPEIYAWIYIPSTNISYPILQREVEVVTKENYNNQLFYKWHDFYGEEKDAGSIFSQYPSSLDYDDQINFLYGNNVLDGSMFQNLHMFSQDVEIKDLHLKEHNEKNLLSRDINDEGIRQLTDDDLTGYIVLKDKKIKFRIYSAYYGSDEHLQFYLENGVLKLKLQTKEERDEYIRNSKDPKSLTKVLYNEEDVNEDSRILTMSTSISNNPTNRLIVQAVFTEEENVQKYVQ